jgi:hypothetical protein
MSTDESRASNQRSRTRSRRGFLDELDRVLYLVEGFLGELKLVLELVEGFLEELKLVLVLVELFCLHVQQLCQKVCQFCVRSCWMLVDRETKTMASIAVKMCVTIRSHHIKRLNH